MNVLVKAEREIANGRLWRAKEILQGTVGHKGYKAEVYECLGRVLLQMQDSSEAGKYLLLSGVLLPEYQDSINTFIKKFEGKSFHLFRTFPRSAKLDNLSDYPPNTAAILRDLGLPERLKDDDGHLTFSPHYDNTGDWLFIGCAFIALFVIALIILGVVKLVELIKS